MTQDNLTTAEQVLVEATLIVFRVLTVVYALLYLNGASA